jgi:hypothetical protein
MGRSQMLDDPADTTRVVVRPSDSAPPETPHVSHLLKRGQNDLSDDDSEGDTTHLSQRKIDINVLPWQATEDADEQAMDPSLWQTRLILENCSRDVAVAKASLINSVKCPQFPHSKWHNLLIGRAVDLNRILSGIYAVSTEPWRQEKLGPIQFVVDEPAPAKSVREYGDWVTAWAPTVIATTYVFPHRKAELEEYGNYSEGQNYCNVLHFWID